MTTLEAIYENGVFKPVGPVLLPDKQRVRIDVRALTPDPNATSPKKPSSELLHWVGALDADVPDLCERIDEYIGDSLASEIKGEPNG